MNSKCISCGKKLRYFGRSERWNILQCKTCGLGVTQGNGEFTQYTTYHRDPVYASEQEQFRNIFEKRVAILTKFKRISRALEVGSSVGTFLSLLQTRGWEVRGVEPSKAAAQAAQKGGIPTTIDTFEETNLPEATFDVVIFNHVLEHMSDPFTVLRKAHKVLRKEGLVFIDAPNFGGLSARILGSRWQYILPREHRWHFTPQALSLLLGKAGFKVLYWETHSGIWNYGNPAKEIWQSLIKRRKRFFMNIITLLPSFIATKMGMGSGVTVIAQKV